MPVLLDAESVARRDAFTMLFWGSLLGSVGNRGLMGFVGAGGFVAVAVALTQLRAAATDRTYRSRAGVALVTAYATAAAEALSAIASHLDSVPGAVVYLASLLLGLVHRFALIGAMSRLTHVWEADRLRRHWLSAFRLNVVSVIVLATPMVIGFTAAADPRLRRGSMSGIVLMFGVGILAGLVALVQYLVAIWQMRSAMQREARLAVPA